MPETKINFFFLALSSANYDNSGGGGGGCFFWGGVGGGGGGGGGVQLPWTCKTVRRTGLRAFLGRACTAEGARPPGVKSVEGES